MPATDNTDRYIPDLCPMFWDQGVGGKRHRCTRRDYPNHTHSCCCGVLLTYDLGNRIKGVRPAST